MFFYGKRTGYLALHVSGEKIKTVGFVQVCGSANNVQITVQVKNAGEVWDGNYPVRLLGYSEIIDIGNIKLCKGNGVFERGIKVRDDMLVIGSLVLPPEKMECVQIQLAEKEDIWGEFCRNSSRKRQSDSISKQSEGEQSRQAQRDALERAEFVKEELPKEPEIVMQEQFYDDKWEQLLKQYKNVHPFGDDRLFIAIEPKDFIILSESYQKLVHNSFLLHGFYNYRYLILGKDGRIGNDTEVCYYLGVPGVFFEREKQVAIMFGFEGFECAGAVDVGKFGYYMRIVTI